MDQDEQVRRAAEAQYILDHPLMTGALKEMEEQIKVQLIACPLDKPENERRLVDSLRMLKQFEQILRTHIETGKLAKFTQERATLFDKWRRKAA